MKALTKKQLAEKERLAAALRAAAVKTETAVDAYNTATEMAARAVVNAVADYNAALQEASSFTEELAAAIQDYYDDRGEKWQESDAGSDYKSWLDAWSAAPLDEIETGLPDALDVPDMEHADAVDDLPETPGV